MSVSSPKTLLLLVAFLGAVASHFFLPGTGTTFVQARLALVPLARLMGQATELVAHRLGSWLGGLYAILAVEFFFIP